MRRVLLVEPGYQNKYPPLGLMKLATYHRGRGDFVRFWKGNARELVLETLLDEAVVAFKRLTPSVEWNSLRPQFRQYVRLRAKAAWGDIEGIAGFYSPTVKLWLDGIREQFRAGSVPDRLKWDRVCVTTLFTFQWDISVRAIEDAKALVKDLSELRVGGIAASLVPDEFEVATGIRPHVGLLSSPGALDPGDLTIIDELPPDYSMLMETDYVYPANDAYLGYTTRGCVRDCPFCAVPRLEPKMVHFHPIAEGVGRVTREFGERRDLLLLDNNVLASNRLDEIVEDIKKAGFSKGARFRHPNQLEVARAGLLRGWNDFGYRRHFWAQVRWLLPHLSPSDAARVKGVMVERCLGLDDAPTNEDCLALYPILSPLCEKHRYGGTVARHVDFNQGVDARLCTDDNVALLAQTAIRPLRIAFDAWRYREPYEHAVRLAAKHRITHLSNYLLYNYQEKPEELWLRMELNIALAEELDLNIFSFPMKYCPVWHEDGYHRNRDYLGPHWNRKFVRTVQSVLNATKGKISRNRDFFEKAFGRTLGEFRELLYMPENYVVLRFRSEGLGLTDAWRTLHNSLSDGQRSAAYPTIYSSKFGLSDLPRTDDPVVAAFLKHYTVTFEQVKDGVGLDSVLP
jgi:hypothetical protein